MDKISDLVEVLMWWGYGLRQAEGMLECGSVVLLFSPDPTDIYYRLKPTDTLKAISSRLKEKDLYLEINGQLKGQLKLCSTSFRA